MNGQRIGHYDVRSRLGGGDRHCEETCYETPRDAYRLVGLGTLAIVVASPTVQQNVAQIEQVKDNLYLVTGGVSNTAAFVTTQGVVLVDTMVPGWGETILDQVR